MTSDADTGRPELAGYTVEHLLGEGGFGQVWRATRNADGGVVAIKLLHLELVRSNDALTRFDREISAIERLHHRNVVRPLEHGTLADGRPYVVLEYIEGLSLRDVIIERRTLPPADALAILEPLCDALATAHELGLVHRDVKASNVILGRDDAGARPVLLDFGLVKLVDGGLPTLTSSRSMLGTPAAMAPEQMKGQPVDARTDVYALGLLAFHMLTGAPPFTGAPGVVQSYLQIHGPRPRPSAHVDIDPAIDEPIVRALQPDPAARFDSVRAFIAALRAAIAPAPAAATESESEVVAVYIEASASELEHAEQLARDHGLTIALSAPDSLLAVGPLTLARAVVEIFSPLVNRGSRVAVGVSRATISAAGVDGPALDVESWAPYPLPEGMWVGLGT